MATQKRFATHRERFSQGNWHRQSTLRLTKFLPGVRWCTKNATSNCSLCCFCVWYEDNSASKSTPLPDTHSSPDQQPTANLTKLRTTTTESGILVFRGGLRLSKPPEQSAWRLPFQFGKADQWICWWLRIWNVSALGKYWNGPWKRWNKVHVLEYMMRCSMLCADTCARCTLLDCSHSLTS